MENTSPAGKWENEEATFQFEINEEITQGIVTFVREGSHYPPLNTLLYKNIKENYAEFFEAEEYFEEEGKGNYRKCLILILDKNSIMIHSESASNESYKQFIRVV